MAIKKFLERYIPEDEPEGLKKTLKLGSIPTAILASGFGIRELYLRFEDSTNGTQAAIIFILCGLSITGVCFKKRHEISKILREKKNR